MASSSSIEAGLQRWAQPRVLVLASGDVERMLLRSHLTLAALLRPLGEALEGVPAAYFRSVAGKSYTLKNFGVKFIAPLEMDALAPAIAYAPDGTSPAATDAADAAQAQAAEQYLDGVLRAAEPPQDRYSDGVQEAADVPSFLRRTPDPAPWFGRYRGEFSETLRYNEAELVDQPLALLVAVSTGDSNPLNLIESLRATKNLPLAFQRGLLDSPSNMLRSIVVLHDKHAEAASGDEQARERAANTFRLIKKQFGNEVLRMLEVNSLPPDAPNLRQKDLWAADVARLVWLHGRRAAQLGISTAPNVNEAPPAGAGAGVGDGLSPPGFAAAASSSPAFSAAASSSLPPVPLAVPPPTEARGQYLSPQDLVQTSAFIGDFLLKFLLPHLERKLGVLSEKVAEKRKGFKNSFKALFGKTRDAGKKNPFSSRTCTYDWHSSESQARQLADLAFVVQDYELAAGSYRMCAGDYKADLAAFRQEVGLKPDSPPFPRLDPSHPRYDPERDRQRRYLEGLTRHQAGALEMLALSVSLGDTGSSGVVSRSAVAELAQALDAAVRDYTLVGDVRRATRAAWFCADVLRWVGGLARIAECCAVLMRASTAEQNQQQQRPSVRSALSMEQAAYLHLSAVPTPLVRKYSFALFRAGAAYHECGQRLLGVRAFSAATLMYQHRAWFEINDRLNQSLGKEHATLGSFAAAVRSYVELIGKSQSVAGVAPRQTQEKQRQFLCEFVEVVNRWRADQERAAAAAAASGASSPSSVAAIKAAAAAGLVPGLKLPTVLDESIAVRTNDATTVPSCYTVAAWNHALRVNPLMALDRAQCNKPLWTPSWPTYKENDRGCVVDEAIHVSFRVSNPLLIPIECSHMRLRCRWKSAPQPNADGAAEEERESSDGVEEGSSPPEGACFSYSTLSLALGPLQTAAVELRVTPLVQGKLIVEGLLWDVMGALRGFHPFALPLRQVTFPVVGGRRRKPELQPDPSLVIPITPPMPLLSVEILGPGAGADAAGPPGFPAHLHHGEIVSRCIVLHNRGACGLHKVCLRLSHPGFVVVARPDAGAGVAAGAGAAALSLGASGGGSGGLGPCYEHTWNEGYINLDLSLQPGERVVLPLWVRGAVEGRHSVGFLFKYEPMSPPSSSAPSSAPSLKHRLAYLSFPLLVTPLFGVKVFTRPSFLHLHDSLLGVEIADKQQSIPVRTMRNGARCARFARFGLVRASASERDPMAAAVNLCVCVADVLVCAAVFMGASFSFFYLLSHLIPWHRASPAHTSTRV